MKKILLTVAVLTLASGCASTSPGRWTFAEWDSRSPEQITAMVPADTAVFENPGTAKEAEKDAAKAMPLEWWSALFDMISGIRVRIRLGTCEWGASK